MKINALRAFLRDRESFWRISRVLGCERAVFARRSDFGAEIGLELLRNWLVERIILCGAQHIKLRMKWVSCCAILAIWCAILAIFGIFA